MTSKLVLVEVDDQGTPFRIIRTAKLARLLPVESVQEVPRAYAVGHIRRQVFARAGCTPYQTGECEQCGRGIIWESGHYNSGELHEVIPRGSPHDPGEVSVANSVAICRSCHTGPNGAHGNRRWQTAKLKEQ